MNMFVEQFAKNFDIPLEQAMSLYPTLQSQWITHQIMQFLTLLAMALFVYCVVMACLQLAFYVQVNNEENSMFSLKYLIQQGLTWKAKTYFLYALAFVGVIIWLRVSTLWLCPDYEFLKYILNYHG